MGPSLAAVGRWAVAYCTARPSSWRQGSRIAAHHPRVSNGRGITTFLGRWRNGGPKLNAGSVTRAATTTTRHVLDHAGCLKLSNGTVNQRHPVKVAAEQLGSRDRSRRPGQQEAGKPLGGEAQARLSGQDYQRRVMDRRNLPWHRLPSLSATWKGTNRPNLLRPVGRFPLPHRDMQNILHSLAGQWGVPTKMPAKLRRGTKRKAVDRSGGDRDLGESG